MKVLEKREKHHSKLLLADTNLKIDGETEGEFKSRRFSERSNFGVIFENFKEASESIQKLARWSQGYSGVTFLPKIEENYRLDFYSTSLPSRN